MEAFVFLLLVVIAVCFVLPLVAIAKATGARRSVEGFEKRFRSLEAELQALKHVPGELRAGQSPAAKGCRAFRLGADCGASRGTPRFGPAAIARGSDGRCGICTATAIAS